jgi:hypothetical protein
MNSSSLTPAVRHTPSATSLRGRVNFSRVVDEGIFSVASTGLALRVNPMLSKIPQQFPQIGHALPPGLDRFR